MAYTRTRVHCINAGSQSACVTSKTDCVCVHDEKHTTTEDLNSKSSEPAFYIVVSEPASDAYYVCTTSQLALFASRCMWLIDKIAEAIAGYYHLSNE